MAIAEQVVGQYLVLVPDGRLVLGGLSEEYEQRVQVLLNGGSLHLVTDLRRVPQIDSTGVRAVVRGYTTAQRLGGSFKLASPPATVRMVLQVTKLDTVLPIFDSVEAATVEASRKA